MNATFSNDADACPRVVIDTNTVLDWLVFRDRSTGCLSAAIEAGRLSWIATGPMREELARVLADGLCGRVPHDQTALWSTWQRLCRPVQPPAAQQLTCSDPDDQMFIDLAIGAHARWLVTRDRALLSLARRAKAHGVLITSAASFTLTPE